MSPENRCCGKCEFWDSSGFKNGKDGLCKRYPPMTEKFLFPIVSMDVFCGEFKERIVIPIPVRKK